MVFQHCSQLNYHSKNVFDLCHQNTNPLITYTASYKVLFLAQEETSSKGGLDNHERGLKTGARKVRGFGLAACLPAQMRGVNTVVTNPSWRMQAPTVVGNAHRGALHRAMRRAVRIIKIVTQTCVKNRGSLPHRVCTTPAGHHEKPLTHFHFCPFVAFGARTHDGIGLVVHLPRLNVDAGGGGRGLPESFDHTDIPGRPVLRDSVHGVGGLDVKRPTGQNLWLLDPSPRGLPLSRVVVTLGIFL